MYSWREKCKWSSFIYFIKISTCFYYHENPDDNNNNDRIIDTYFNLNIQVCTDSSIERL